MKMVIYSMVLIVLFCGRIKAQVDHIGVSADSSVMRLSMKDGKVSHPAAFYTVLNEAGEPISVTDINGKASLKTGEFVTVRSFFIRDTSFMVPGQSSFSVMLASEVIDLEEVEVTSYTVEKLMNLAGRKFGSSYPSTPLLFHVNAYSFDEETDEDFIVHFKTRERYRRENAKNIFLIGEGVLVIDKTNLKITEVNFEFSQYHDVNFEINRQGRRKDVAGEIRLRYKGNEVYNLSEPEFTCYYLGDNWFSPRENPVDHGIERYEKVGFGRHTEAPLKSDFLQYDNYIFKLLNNRVLNASFLFR
jgi:hypothetical protein